MKKGEAVWHRLFVGGDQAGAPDAGSVTAAVAAAAATTATAVAAAIATAATAAVATTAAFATAATTTTTVATAAAFTTAAAETTTAAATAAIATTVGAAEAGRTLFTGASLVHDNGAACNRLTVQAIDGGLRLGVRAHFDETEALGAAGVTVHHDLGGAHGSILRESILQILIAHAVGQIAHVKFVAHERAPFNK